MFEPPQYVFVSIFLYPLCRCLYIFVSLYDTYYIEHVSVRNNKNQASQVFVLTYLDGFAVCLWKLVSPTWSAKILATEIFTKLWRTQRRRYNAGGQNLWDVRRIRGLSWELCCCKVVFGTFFFKGCLRKFWNRNFREKRRPAAFEAQRGGPKIVGHFRDFAVCLWNLLRPTWSAKILGTKISTQHGRHAAFEIPRGEPKIVGYLSDSRFLLGTLLLQGCLWNLLPQRVVRENFGNRNFCKA